MSKKFFKIAFPSELFKVKSIILNTVEFIRLNLLTIDENDLYDLRLIYSELLCNAIIHGNKNDSGKYVNLTVELDDDTVRSIISDEGNGFDYIALLAEARSANNIFKERGRGVMLAQSLSDTITFNGSGNEVRFVKKVNLNG